MFAFIDVLAFSPIARTKDADGSSTVRKPDGENTTPNCAKAVIPFFRLTMGEVFRHDTVWIRKGVLRLRERYAVLGLMFEVLLAVPFKARFAHGTRLSTPTRGSTNAGILRV
jgi:hypothetical protein